jgi:hypothetical protein
VSVLDEYLALGMVPEVDGLGDDGVVLGLEEVIDEVVDEGSLALAEVLALGGLTVMAVLKLMLKAVLEAAGLFWEQHFGWPVLRLFTVAVGGVHSVPIESGFRYSVCFASQKSVNLISFKGIPQLLCRRC